MHDKQKFESEVCKRIFNHASMASFRRQLNSYGFHKIKVDGALAYSHERVKCKADILLVQKSKMTENERKMELIRGAADLSGLQVSDQKGSAPCTCECSSTLREHQNLIDALNKKVETLQQQLEQLLPGKVGGGLDKAKKEKAAVSVETGEVAATKKTPVSDTLLQAATLMCNCLDIDVKEDASSLFVLCSNCGNRCSCDNTCSCM